MTKIFVNIGLSLVAYMAPEGMDIAHWGTPDARCYAPALCACLNIRCHFTHDAAI